MRNNILVIFVFLLLAVPDFVPMPHSTFCIMVPYYLGQLLLFIGVVRVRDTYLLYPCRKNLGAD